jgi:glycosyltransferase involved in cell wall biosynthesis
MNKIKDKIRRLLFGKSLNNLNLRLSNLEYVQKYSEIYRRLKERSGILDKFNNQESILTICMPTYNGQDYIARALESILMQETTYKYKIWIIDDCSTDNTVNIIREYIKLYPDIIKLEVNEKNEKALTMAPKIFKGVETKYWMNFDQDDYWLSKDKLQRSVDYFELHSDCTLVTSNLFVKQSANLILSYTGNRKFFDFEFKDYPYPLGILMQTSATMFRNVFTKIDLDKLLSYVGTPKDYYVLGDTFRNLFALSKGYGHYESSVDSVYSWTGTGVWSKLDSAHQNFLEIKDFYGRIEFFENKEQKKHLKDMAQFYIKRLLPELNKLTKEEINEFNKIKNALLYKESYQV